MIADLKPYPVMRNSGVPWLGAVPTHWRTHPVRRYCRVFAGATPSRSVAHYWENGSIPWLSSGDVNLRRIRTARQFITDAGLKNSSANWIRPGSLVVALAGQGKTKGMVATVEVSTTCNQSLAVIEPADSESRYEYLAYYLESRYQDIRALVGDGLRDGLNLEHVRSIPTPLPPLPEQAAIVRFLDHADRRIRRYIHAKHQLIALLEEQKQALIHRAVTRGLDPTVRLRPSAVRWLGDIPEHWEIWQIGHLGQVGNGSTPSRSNMGYWDGGTYPWLNSSSVNHSPITQAAQFVTDLALRECHLPRVQTGSVLVAITGQGKTRGISAALDTEATINQHVAYVTPRNDVIGAEYLQLALSAAYRELRAISDDSGSTKGALTCWDISHFRVPLPPRAEQAEITLATRQATKTLESTSAKAAQEVMLAREYRTRLIADVVTGKLDVRAAAAGLPEVDPLAAEEDDSDDGSNPEAPLSHGDEVGVTGQEAEA